MFHSETESAEEPGGGPSLIEKVAEIHREKKTGQLHLMQGTRLASVWFLDGGISHADGLPDLFAEESMAAPPGGYSGDLMADIGGVIAAGTPPEDALRAAHRGIVRTLATAGAAFQANWGFQEGVPSPPGSMPLPGDVTKDLIAALEGNPNLDLSQDDAEELSQHELSVEGKILPTDGFPPVALRVYRLAAKGRTLSEALEEIGGDGARQALARKSIAMLRALGLLQLSDRPRMDRPAAPESPPQETTNRALNRGDGKPPTSRKPEPEESSSVPMDSDALFRRAAEVEGMNPLLAIGLDPDEIEEPITPDMVRSAFRREATAYHPDRLRGLSEEAKEAAEAVFSAFNEIRNLVTTQQDIDACIKKLRQERSGVREITDFDRERARVMGRKASGYMRHKKWQPGLELVRQAIELDPENTMLRLWECFGKGVLKEVSYEQAAQEILDLEIDNRKDRAEALYRAGCLWRLAGKEKQALRCFTDAVAKMPSHNEAQTELRVLQKRHSENAEKAESNIPFARFFKKKTP